MTHADASWRLIGGDGLVLMRYRALRFYMYVRGVRIGSVSFNRYGTVFGLDYEVEDKAYRRLGYATQAVALACTWAFDELLEPRIVATVRRDNVASQRVLRRCGFSITQVSRRLLDYQKKNPAVL